MFETSKLETLGNFEFLMMSTSETGKPSRLVPLKDFSIPTVRCVTFKT
jgi:hypothetical protein